MLTVFRQSLRKRPMASRCQPPPSRGREATSLAPRPRALNRPLASSSRAPDSAPTVVVDTDRDNRGNQYDAAILPHLHISGVDPQIWPVALDGPIQECIDALVNLLAKPRHLAFGDTAHRLRPNLPATGDVVVQFDQLRAFARSSPR